jgi:hypothetical protein
MASSKTTLLGEPILDGLPIAVPQILMPRADISLDKWATVACDQFESEPAYWKEMAEYAAGQPSALNIIFPEVYLASVTGADPSEDSKRIAEIGKTMKQYVADGVFRERAPAFLALDRKTSEVPTRKGLIMAVDLDEYNYNCPEPTLIRPTEKTIVARLPPRIEIRKDAPLELPHIIMIIDDPDKTVIEPLFTQEGLTELEYECSLFKGAGSVKGLKVTEKGTEHFAASMKAIAAKEYAAAEKASRKPSIILIGDGNHSLATAKSCWENLKTQDGIDKERHPARYALVELQNLHDDGVVFEPIHRILEGANADDIQTTLETAWGCKATPFVSPQPIHSVVIVRPEGKFTLVPPMDKLPIVSMTEPMDDYVAKHPSVKIGYVHGEEPVDEAVKAGHAVGLLLPKLDKSRFLETVHQIGTLPRKAFSMGEANEKRFYVEARKILM